MSAYALHILNECRHLQVVPVISSFYCDRLRLGEVYKTFLSHWGLCVEYAEVGAMLPFPLSRTQRLVAAQT